MLPSRRDLDFQLYEVLDVPALGAHPAFAEHDRTSFDAVLDGAFRLAAEHYAPHAATADAEEPVLVDGRVRLPAAAAPALAATAAGGWFAAPFPAELGGLQLPWSVVQAANAVFAGANVGFYGYVLLTVGAANLLAAHGTTAQVRRYVRPLLEGRWFGTMCLSEPQAGSSLADVRTRAEPLGDGRDGRHRLRGTKMWISGGEHELAENIVHLVLAKVPGGPPGVKGLSLFAVPKRHVDEAGRAGERNDVRCVGLNHKMGWRGTVNTVLELGERGECVGELVGPLHGGLACMFHMMNEARIGVGLCAAALGAVAYRHALEYARARPQGRPPGERDPTVPPVPILRHADVRRLLLQQKAYVEGALALVLWCARLVDARRVATEPGERAELTLLLELLTPIAKSWPAEYALEANKLAIQVLGGYGYTRDYPLERLYRDNRLNHIHEGTWGIHGLDVLGRKVQMEGGAALEALARRIRASTAAAADSPQLAPCGAALEATLARTLAITATLVASVRAGAVERALANATPYLDALGHLVVAWRWLEQARVAERALAAGAAAAERGFYLGKLAACRYFFRYELPRTGPVLDLLASLDDTALTVPEDAW